MGELFREADPPPRAKLNIDFNFSDPSTWEYKLLTPRQAHDKLTHTINIPIRVWQDVIDCIPSWVRKVMYQGPKSLLHCSEGWGAMVVADADSGDDIGDIFYFSKCNSKETNTGKYTGIARHLMVSP